jgi:DNA-binding IclR family transcriptional regulator
MRNWVRLTGFTAFITCPLPDWSSVIVDKVEGTMPLRVTVEVGDRFPADAGAIGKVFLAYLTEAERALLNVQLTRYTEHSISNRDNWATELSTISLRGWSDSRGEYYAGGNAVAAPVFGPLGDVVAVMGSLAATTQLRDEDLPRLGPVMADSAQRISSELSA